MTPQEFITKWGPGGPAFDLNERQGAQAHFIDLCNLLDVPTPGSEADYIFEQDTLILGAARGYADVFMRDHFAWENKAPGRNLDEALKQLLGYSLALYNPPLLVVSDRLTIRIHTQFNGHPSEVHTVLLNELDQPEKQALLRRLWTNPESFRPKNTSRDITEAAAKSFATLADGLRKRGPDYQADPAGWQTHADEVAHFLTQCLFCFFAEDVGLLPDRMFEGLVGNKALTSDRLTQGLKNLFVTMRNGGMYGNDEIPWFNGGLFKKVSVPDLSIMEVTELRNAAALNWSAIDVSIFGTLFERGLDPSKRSQLGAHYTDPDTIMRIVVPVLVRPLMQTWNQIASEMAKLLSQSKRKKAAAYTAGGRRFRATAGDAYFQKAERMFHDWLQYLKGFRVLDPACGSGNFLFLGLKALKDIEHKSHLDAAILGLDREADLVTGPQNVLGIELNEYAAELARVTVWIGELQWRIEHGYEFKTTPVLEPMDNIECRDALLKLEGGQVSEAAWPQASVVIGNPPFLGDKKMRTELGEQYTLILRKVFDGRIPGGADLVCYWFEKARNAIQCSGLGAAGLVSTNSIRGGKNRKVLEAICETTRIYEAWGDEAWVNDGAAVRVSLIAFGHASQGAMLDGNTADSIYADLTSAGVDLQNVNLTSAVRLVANGNSAFQGSVKVGSFDVEGEVAREWLRAPNVNGKSNAEVLRPLRNARDLTTKPRDAWIVDFERISLEDAQQYESPFDHVRRFVKPFRDQNRDASRRKNWWLHGRTGDDLRAATAPIDRVIVTPRVAKFRLFVFVAKRVYVDDATALIARSDDTTFGILHSRFHELWSLRMCTWLGVGNDPRYTPTSCFETFPFPTGLTPADTAHQRTSILADGSQIPSDLPNPTLKQQATHIAIAAKKLNELRETWLNPPEWTDRVTEVVPLGMTTSPYPDRVLPKPGHEKNLADRTLTKLYNQRPAWLDSAHKTLDFAVAKAYGWTDYTATMPDEEILKRLLTLNLERAG